MWMKPSTISFVLSLLLASTNNVQITNAFTGITSSAFVSTPKLNTAGMTGTTLHPNDVRRTSTFLSMSIFEGLDGIPALSSTGMFLSEDLGKTGEVIKGLVIFLFFGGGLIPAAIAANQSMFTTITGGKKKEEVGNPETSFDPTAAIEKSYISSSGAAGPTLPNSALIFATENIPLVDMLAIAGRMTDVNSIADWKNLPSAKMEGLMDPNNPPMWLPRATFKANIRAAKFQSWPVDPNTGLPVGGEELEKLEKGRISKKNALIGDAALDAVFDTWAWGAGIATPDKVQNQLNDWRVGDSLDVGKLTNAAIRGRATTGFAAFTFIAIQVIAYGTLFIAPALRVLFDIDIGFGIFGECSDNGCTKLF